MDFLKAEIANKRKALSPPSAADPSSSSSSSSSAPNKYIRRGDLERQQRQHHHRSQPHTPPSAPSSQPRPPSTTKSGPSSSNPTGPSTSTSSSTNSVATPEPDPDPASSLASTAREGFNISNDEAIRRLRAKAQPIRLFAETDKARRLRLRALELIEEKGERSGQNDFRTAMQSAESGMALELLERRNASDKGRRERERIEAAATAAAAAAAAKRGDASVETVGASVEAARGNEDGPEAEEESTAAAVEEKRRKEGIGMESVLDLGLMKRDTARVYPIIYYTLKGLLQDWADHLAARPDEVKQTTQGKLAAATQVQSSEYLKPLFKQLRKRTLAPDVLMRLAEIIHYVQKREYRHANDAYLQLSIGNAPWPIGVTMVGIHERSGREKIFSSNVAHVLNDEVSRKYIQSLKRVMTFAQGRYPPKDVSMLMG